MVLTCLIFIGRNKSSLIILSSSASLCRSTILCNLYLRIIIIIRIDDQFTLIFNILRNIF